MVTTTNRNDVRGLFGSNHLIDDNNKNNDNLDDNYEILEEIGGMKVKSPFTIINATYQESMTAFVSCDSLIVHEEFNHNVDSSCHFNLLQIL